MTESKKSDVIEIPIGKLGLGNIRKNPWILTTLIFGVLLLILLIVNGGSSAEISQERAADNLISFIDAQGQGGVDLVSTSRQGGLYEVIVSSGGQEVPIYVTLDGKFAFLADDAIPIINADSGVGQDAESVDSEDVGQINLGDSPIKGNANAPVVLVEFSDYQCPFCRSFWSGALPLIQQNYIDTGKVKLVYKDFPLNSIHPQAQKAAEAARCVGEQKGDAGYYQMHDLLFENQNDLSVANLKKLALKTGVSTGTFNNCLDSGKYASEVNADLAYGSSLGVSGTPGFFIGNDQEGYVKISGAQPYSVFEQAIESFI